MKREREADADHGPEGADAGNPVLMARERGRIGSDAALGDMPKRLQAHSYDEMNEGPAR